MSPQDKRSASELAAEIVASDRPSTAAPEDPAPVGLAFSPGALLLYPFLRRHRQKLLPWVVLATVAAVLASVLL